MDTLRIQQEILDVFETNSIYSFPIDCFSLLRKYGYECLKYSDQNPEKKATCLQVSDDAFRLKKKVYYNDTLQNCRIRFTLMHELGHHVLNHTGDSQQNETDANYFASNILAPRLAIHYSECKNANDVSHIFSMSFSAAEIAFDDYRRWRRYVAYHKMSVLDKAMYRHFFNSNANRFVWHMEQCWDCGREIYNQPGKEFCSVCSARSGLGHDPDSEASDPLSLDARVLGYITTI